MRFALKFLLSIVASLCFTTAASAQVNYSWNNSGTDWTAAGSWNPAGGPPGTVDSAFFVATSGTATTNPILNASTTVAQTRFSTAANTPWSLTGTGSLSSGTAAGVTGLVLNSGLGTTTINLGNGTVNSLILAGPTGTTIGGALQIGNNSRLVLSGNTVATATNNVIMRGGTLVLDNSAGNPTSQRMTTSGGVTLAGGGSTIEFRGAASGTAFNGFTGALGSAGSGDTTLRTVQTSGGSLNVSFASMSRVNTSGLHYFENIGTGFVGDSGAPTVTFTTAPTTRQGVISTSATTTIPYAMVTNRATPTGTVTGRWANYNSGVVASSVSAFTGDFSGATAGSNILFNANSAGTVTQAGTGNQLATVVFEAGASGITYDLGTNQLNTLAVAVSGANDITVTGGSLFSTGTAGTRALVVLNSTTSLFTNSNLAANNSPLTIGGQGFTILTGTANQIGWTAAQNLNLAGGVLRVNTSNFITTNATVRFRGGVLEYDVSGGNATFNLALGTGANNVNWTSNAGDAASTNVGSGGFSAFSTVPANTLTVNLGGAGADVVWNDTGASLFVTNNNALKFGSLKSNATVVFQNGINLGATSTVPQAREINVTLGVGNLEDRTQLTGVISGTALHSLVKTGTGVLELSGTNTYLGSTVVMGGTLNVNGNQSAATGALVVNNTATLGGTGTVGGSTLVASGGTIRGGATTATTTLTTGNVTVANGGAIFANLGATTVSSKLALGTNTLDLKTGSVLRLDDVSGFSVTAAGTWNIAELTSGTTLQLDAAGVADGFLFGSYTNGSNSGPVNIDVSALPTLAATDVLELRRSGNNLVLTFVPVPEPALLFGLAVGLLGAGAAVRKKFFNRA
jgi:fibronectin-binding autotransporter adhesin